LQHGAAVAVLATAQPMAPRHSEAATTRYPLK
jgi:hypothetical protein